MWRCNVKRKKCGRDERSKGRKRKGRKSWVYSIVQYSSIDRSIFRWFPRRCLCLCVCVFVRACVCIPRRGEKRRHVSAYKKSARLSSSAPRFRSSALYTMHSFIIQSHRGIARNRHCNALIRIVQFVPHSLIHLHALTTPEIGIKNRVFRRHQ